MSAPVHCAAGSDFETNFGLTSLAAPQAASSSVSRYSLTERRVAAIASQSTSSDAFRGALLVRVRLDQAGVGREALAADQPWGSVGLVDTLKLSPEVLPMPRTHPPYSPEFRRQMVDLVRAGRDPDDLAREFEPTGQSIRSWVAQADRN